MDYVIGLTSSTPTGPCHVLRWTSKFTLRLATSSLDGEVYALSEIVGHMSLLREFYGPFGGLGPGMMGLEDCESPFNRPKAKKMIAETYLVRHFLRTQHVLVGSELDNVYWAPGTENPADGLTKVRSDMEPLLRLLESGHRNPGSMRPPKGVAW